MLMSPHRAVLGRSQTKANLVERLDQRAMPPEKNRNRQMPVIKKPCAQEQSRQRRKKQPADEASVSSSPGTSVDTNYTDIMDRFSDHDQKVKTKPYKITQDTWCMPVRKHHLMHWNIMMTLQHYARGPMSWNFVQQARAMVKAWLVSQALATWYMHIALADAVASHDALDFILANRNGSEEFPHIRTQAYDIDRTGKVMEVQPLWPVEECNPPSEHTRIYLAAKMKQITGMSIHLMRTVHIHNGIQLD